MMMQKICPAAVNVRTQEAIEVLAVCLHHKEKLILECIMMMQKICPESTPPPLPLPSHLWASSRAALSLAPHWITTSPPRLELSRSL